MNSITLAASVNAAALQTVKMSRLRRRSPPPLHRSSSPTRRPKSLLHPAILAPRDARNPTRWLAILAAFGAVAWLAATFSMVAVHEQSGAQHVNRLPIPLSTVKSRTERAASHLRHVHRRTKKAPKLPKHYFQLSPPTANDDPNPWTWPVVHIVSTRFMQDQGTLVHLARSRLKLMETVTLPSLMDQTLFDGGETLSMVYSHTKWEKEFDELQRRRQRATDPAFLWVVKVDPNLDKTILKELLEVLEPVKGFAVVVGSNRNFGIGIKPGGWRDGQAGQDILDAYDNGHVHFPGGEDAIHTIRRAHEAREDRVVIETRLDADDAVHVDYLATLQLGAVRTLVDPQFSEYDGYVEPDSEDNQPSPEEVKEQMQTARWLYWCPQSHVQWNPSTSDKDPGYLQVFRMPGTCVTAGLSLGFAVGATEDNVPRYQHTKIYWKITVKYNNEGKRPAADAPIDKNDCGLYPSSKCAVFVEEPRVAAFRSRALTSAGMHNIEAQGGQTVKTNRKYREYAAQMWQKGTIERQFGIKTEKAKEAADFMQANYLETVKDNLRGQCTSGHSCKISTTEKLRSTIDLLEEEPGGLEVHQDKPPSGDEDDDGGGDDDDS
ncbi:hypothetical protein ACHAXT_006838 [Thalassiosira profunda]